MEIDIHPIYMEFIAQIITFILIILAILLFLKLFKYLNLKIKYLRKKLEEE
jgi:large-conductance mechanosensitive channel